MRLKEAKGVYNIERLYDESCVKRRLDVADYRGPISIEEIPNKGKGYVATEDIAKGTLLLAEKAFSCAFDDESEGILFCLNTITNICQEPSKLLTIIGAIDKLRYNPSKRREFYSLYAGPGFPRSNEQQNLEGLTFTTYELIAVKRLSYELLPPSGSKLARSVWQAHFPYCFTVSSLRNVLEGERKQIITSV